MGKFIYLAVIAKKPVYPKNNQDSPNELDAYESDEWVKYASEQFHDGAFDVCSGAGDIPEFQDLFYITITQRDINFQYAVS